MIPTGILVTGMYLGGALLAGALVIALASRWWRQPRAEPLTPSEQLAQFRTLYEQGAISQEEFNRLRTLLGGQLRQALDVPPTTPPPTAVRPAPGVQPPPGPPGDDHPPETGIRPA